MKAYEGLKKSSGVRSTLFTGVIYKKVSHVQMKNLSITKGDVIENLHFKKID